MRIAASHGCCHFGSIADALEAIVCFPPWSPPRGPTRNSSAAPGRLPVRIAGRKVRKPRGVWLSERRLCLLCLSWWVAWSSGRPSHWGSVRVRQGGKAPPSCADVAGWGRVVS